jgi:hypothetical protein
MTLEIQTMQCCTQETIRRKLVVYNTNNTRSQYITDQQVASLNGSRPILNPGPAGMLTYKPQSLAKVVGTELFNNPTTPQSSTSTVV